MAISYTLLDICKDGLVLFQVLLNFLPNNANFKLLLLYWGIVMIDYKGLDMLLIEREKDRKYLHEHLGLSWDTIAKFKKGESVTLATIEKICIHFNCNIEDIVKIKRP